MPVMAAGVHLAGHGRLIGQVVRLLARPRIHIGAQADDLVAVTAALAAADQSDHAGAADAGDDLVAAERLELLGHRRRGAMHVVH